MAPRVRPIGEFVYEMGRPTIFGIIRDLGGQGIDIVTKGADPSGTTDSTEAINAALAEAVTFTPPKAIILPPGRFLTNGGHDLSGKDGLAILGAGIGATTLVTTHATNDIFSYGGDDLADLHIGQFSVIAPTTTTRSAGWFFRGTTASPGGAYLVRCRFYDLDIKWQTNGIWIPQYEFVWCNRIFMSDFAGAGNGIGVKAGQTAVGAQNQGSEIYFTDCQVYGSAFLNPGGLSKLQYGFWIEDCQAIYVTQSAAGGSVANNWRFVSNAAGAGIQNCFFDSLISDATDTSHSTYITGTGQYNALGWSNSWFSGAGRLHAGTGLGNGVRCDAANVSGLSFSACRLLLNRGTGMYLAPGAGGSLTLTGNIFGSNGEGGDANNKDSIFVNVGVGSIGAIMAGNLCGGVVGTGVSVRTPIGSTTDMVITGNRWASGVSYGAVPAVDANNL